MNISTYAKSLKTKFFGYFYLPRIEMFYQFFAHTTYNAFTFFHFALERSPWDYLALLAFTFSLDLFMNWRHSDLPDRKIKFPVSGLVAGGAIFLNLEGYGLLPYLFAGFIGIISKHTFTYRGRHVFNPGNIGVLAAIMLLSDRATSSFDLWTSPAPFIAWILVIGGFVVWTARRWIVMLSYNVTFAAMTFILLSPQLPLRATLLANLSISPLVLAGSLFSAGSLIFSFHMITDPRTTPSKGSEQMVFGAAVALVDLLLRLHLFLDAPYIANAVVCLGYFLYWKTTEDRSENPLTPGPIATYNGLRTN